MPEFKKPKCTLNLGDPDVAARITSTTVPQDSAIAECRVRRYQGYLRNSMIAGFSPALANAGSRSLNIAFGHQSPPSPRLRRLLNDLPRLDTGVGQRPLEPEQDYFSLFGGWERKVQPPPRPAIRITPTLSNADRVRLPADVVGYFDWYTVMSEEAQRAQMATDRYIAVTELNRIVMARQEAADRAAREAREAEFYRSLLRETAIVDHAAFWMRENEEPLLVGLVPMYDQWRYRTASKALERARDERRWREAWALEFADTRHLVMQFSW